MLFRTLALVGLALLVAGTTDASASGAAHRHRHGHGHGHVRTAGRHHPGKRMVLAAPRRKVPAVPIALRAEAAEPVRATAIKP